MSRYWLVTDPVYSQTGELVEEEVLKFTRQDILDLYWDHWYKAGIQAGANPEELTEDRCIDDWATIHWAVQVDADG